MKNSDSTVLIGVKRRTGLGLNCGGCGFATCKEMMKTSEANQSIDTDYPGPNCIFKVSDLGIAIESAVKTASIHNVDNRVMYSAGVAAMKLGMMNSCTIEFGSHSKHLEKISTLLPQLSINHSLMETEKNILF